jgi:hypothetical protein
VLGTVVRVLLALGAIWLFWKLGTALLGSFARPVPEAPPEGELRKLKLRYRCSLCGMELRIDRAASDAPDAPRHCMDEMELVAAQEL